MKQNKQYQGFTIIEVVLVLAIAGLIFLMVFIALPALRINQRDTQRKNDLSRMQTAINSFQSNNRGQAPFIGSGTAPEGTKAITADNFAAQYMKAGGASFVDPDGTNYKIVDSGVLSGTESAIPSSLNAFSHNIIIFHNATCNGETLDKASGNNKVALRFKLEGGGVYCLNN